MAFVCFQKTKVVISQSSIEIMSTKFGLLMDFDLLKAAISTNAKSEMVLLRFGRHIALSRWRPLNTISGFALCKVTHTQRSNVRLKTAEHHIRTNMS